MRGFSSDLKIRGRCFDAMLGTRNIAFPDEEEDCKPAFKRPKQERPLLLEGSPITHRQMLDMLYTLDFDDKAKEVPKVLPLELAARVVSFLTVEPAQPNRVRPICSSTHDGVHPLSESLSESETTWWLAHQGSMPQGKGRQYIQYSLSHTLCRLRRVVLKIPPLPLGPLSVREFYLETFRVERGWFKISPTYLVENREGWQAFNLPNDGCDVDEVRVVCLSNQMAEYLEDLDTSVVRSRGLFADIQRFASVGFFSIRFE